MNRNGFALALISCAMTACATIDLDNSLHVGSQKLGIVFFEEGKPVAMESTESLSTVKLTNNRFAILTPTTDQPIRICASTSPVIFLQSAVSSPTCFAPGTEIAAGRNDPLLLSIGDKHNHFATSGTANGKRYRAIHVDGFEGNRAAKEVYLSIFVDKNGNRVFERKEFEHFAIIFPREGVHPMRTEDEIRPVFQIHAKKIDREYTKALRKNPALAGKVVVRFTILPSGKVSHANMASSSLRNSAFSQKILSLIRSFNFGPKKVPAFTVNHALEFSPPDPKKR